MDKKTMWVAVLAALLSGCGEVPVVERVETSVERENRLIQFAANALPNGAKVVTDHGNGWITFDLETEGKMRRFLYRKHWYYTTNGHNVASECITELSK